MQNIDQTNKKKFMRRAIQLSKEKMLANKGGPFGAVIVQNEEIISEGFNQVTSLKDPTAHAEIIAIRNACRKLNSYHLIGTEIYCSCEPCPMCLSTIYWAHIEKVYYANSSKDAQQIGFDDKHIFNELTKDKSQRKIPIIQILSEEGKAVFNAWIEKPDKTLY